MSRSSMALCLFLLVTFLAPARAKETPSPTTPPFVLEFELVHSKNPPARRVLETETWHKEIQTARSSVLESGRSISGAGIRTLVHIGLKRPFVYFDPRVSGSQVQYTDLGFKADWKPQPLENGLCEVDIRIEKAQLVKPETSTSYVYVHEGKVMLRRGQSAIVSTARGLLTAKYFGSLYPEAGLKEDSTVMLVISLK